MGERKKRKRVRDSRDPDWSKVPMIEYPDDKSNTEFVQMVAGLDAAEKPFAIHWGLDRLDSAFHTGERRWLAVDACGTVLDGNQFAAIRQRLPQELRAIDEGFLNTYLKGDALASSTQIAIEAAWIGADVNLLAKAGLTYADIQSMGRSLPVRQGVKELFRRFDHRCLVSFGIKPLLEAWLIHHHLKADVRAANILFDIRGNIICVDPCTVVTSYTKYDQTKLFLARTKGIRPNGAVTIGDDPRVDRRLWQAGTFNILVRNSTSKRTRVDLLQSDDYKHLHLIVSDLKTLNAVLTELGHHSPVIL